jgi:glycosyltransferase involved in cell wall biosynthesis
VARRSHWSGHMTITCRRIPAVTPRSTFDRKVAIAIPAYNEGRHLAELIARCRATEPALIVVVDDASSDETPAVLARLAAEPGAPLLALRNEPNLGKQGSVRRALNALLKDRDIEAVALIDGDLQHDPAELPGLVALLTEHDAVIGARSRTEMPRHRRLSNWLVDRTFALFAGVDFADVQSGLRIYTKPIADALARALPERGRFGIEHESLTILAQLSVARSLPVRVAAATISCRYGDETSHITFFDIFRLARDTVRHALRLRRATRPALAPQSAYSTPYLSRR